MLDAITIRADSLSAVQIPHDHEEHCVEWIDGVAIISAVFIVGGVTAFNNYRSEQQFRVLQAKQDDSVVIVKRDNAVVQISVRPDPASL